MKVRASVHKVSPPFSFLIKTDIFDTSLDNIKDAYNQTIMDIVFYDIRDKVASRVHSPVISLKREIGQYLKKEIRKYGNSKRSLQCLPR